MIAVWLCFGAGAAPPVAPTVNVLMRTLSYDRALPARASAPFQVAVVYVRDQPLSAAQAIEAQRALAALVGTTVQGTPLGPPIMVAVIDGLGMETPLAGVDAVLVCRGLGPRLRAVITTADALDLPVLALDPADMGQGVALSVAHTHAKLELLVDLPATKRQGMDLSADLLRIAGTLIR